MFCQNCGKEIDDNSAVCVHCGVALMPKSAQQPVGDRSRVVAAVLAILVGSFGVHNFYMGYIGKGLAQVLITVLSCCIASPISGIWSLIEGILILTGKIDRDAKGNLLRD